MHRAMRWKAIRWKSVRWKVAWLLAAAAAVANGHAPDGDGRSEGVVTAQEAAPVVDGIVSEGEYGLALRYDGVVIGMAIAGDTLYVAAAASTAGWVGVGFGSDVMDGARILFSFVDGDGTVFFAEQEGSGHRHRDVNDAVATAHAVREHDGTTTLEAALPAAFVRATAGDGGVFPMILAYGRRDSVRTVHRFFKSIELTLG